MVSFRHNRAQSASFFAWEAVNCPRIELWFSWLRKQQERCDLDQQALREDQLVFVKVLPYLLREGVRLPGSDKYTVQTLGFALVVVGALLFIISLYNLTLGVPITLVIVGVILII